ncbi:Receptor expression-enhancing protein 6 [Durusdinium trenchii]|uniref:Receptor expression-enhancing protein 6 n=1 Tax=Durusdinium trenchii TaxID=1381693 RepID=A0ABP0P1P7_9DINO
MGRHSSVSLDSYSYDSDDSDVGGSKRKFKLPKLTLAMPVIELPTQEQMLEQMADFQDAVMDNMPSRKEIKHQRRVARRTYSRFMEGLYDLEWLDGIEDATNIPRIVFLYLGLGAMAGVTVLSFFVMFLGLFMTRFVGLAYPLYASIKAVISEDKDDDTQWLMYWVVYSFFGLFEQIALTQNKGLPIYFSIKLGILLFCQVFNGAELLHKILIRPFVKAIRLVFGDGRLSNE